MKDLAKTIEIAESLGLSNIAKELESIQLRSQQENATIILPLVGEFSSGKTTLINSLTDSKKLETATKPTTATIYEVHFGAEVCKAQVVKANNTIEEVADIAELRNDVLADAKVVTVFDTSTKVPSTTILVDTPGLSSPDPRHKQTLVEFLPMADAVILAIDVNTGTISRSLLDFVKTMNLAKKTVFVVITQCATKSKTDVENVRSLVKETLGISNDKIACVSAKEGDLDEILSLFDNIQKEKKEIIEQVDEQRVKSNLSKIISHIDELIKASSSDKELEQAIRKAQYDLEKINRNIESLIESMSDDIEQKNKSVFREFEDTILNKLGSLVASKSTNFDGEAVSAINATASILMNKFKNGIQGLLRENAKSKIGSEGEVPLSSLGEIDTSMIKMTNLSYDLDLNTMGHEYDSLIASGVKVAAVAAAAMYGAGTAGAGAAFDAADTVSDVMCDGDAVVTNTVRATNNKQAKGLVESVVGLVTDNFVSKPQRQRAIRNYIDSTLAPQFKDGLQLITQDLINSIRNKLQAEASQCIEQKTNNLNQLKSEMAKQKDEFIKRMSQLKDYKIELLSF